MIWKIIITVIIGMIIWLMGSVGLAIILAQIRHGDDDEEGDMS
jgi:hypothetical protein